MSPASSSALLRSEIEARLATRIPAALSPQPQQTPRLLMTGVPAVDVLLGGGLPIGGISEITGAASSGRTSLAYSVLAQASREAACAYVDAGSCLDPFNTAAAGVRLENLLWIRLDAQGSQRLPVRTTGSGGVFHKGFKPRSTEQAVGAVLAQKAQARLRKQEGTPGYPNQPFGLLAAPSEHAAFERMFENDPLVGESPCEPQEERQPIAPAALQPMGGKQPWSLLDQTIRAVDQILQSGGFQVVVLDLAAIALEQVLRISSATWFRFCRAAQESDTVLLLLTAQPCAGSSAACVLHCSPGTKPSVEHNVFRRSTQIVEVTRQRVAVAYARKSPGRVVSWQAAPPWMQQAGS